jgi:PEGA domain
MRDLLLLVLTSAATLLLGAAASAQTPTTDASAVSASSATPMSPAPGPAAQTPPSLADALAGAARDDYLAARALYEGRDYAGALLRFEAAYDASRDARLLWNAAVCQKAMGHYAKAMSLVRRYLDSGSPLITLTAARNARAFIDAAESRTARLDVVSNETDARVYFDGESVGSTPLRQAFPVDPGVHEVVVKKSGFADFSTPITVTGSADVRVQAPLGWLVRDGTHEGRIAIHARGGDAIAVDGRVVAGETWEGALPGGMHSVRVTAPGKRPFQGEALVSEGQTRTFDVKLEPDRGWAGLPTWAWIVGGTALAAGATTAGYFLLKPAAESAAPMPGSIATVHAP